MYIHTGIQFCACVVQLNVVLKLKLMKKKPEKRRIFVASRIQEINHFILCILYRKMKTTDIKSVKKFTKKTK